MAVNKSVQQAMDPNSTRKQFNHWAATLSWKNDLRSTGSVRRNAVFKIIQALDAKLPSQEWEFTQDYKNDTFTMQSHPTAVTLVWPERDNPLFHCFLWHDQTQLADVNPDDPGELQGVTDTITTALLRQPTTPLTAIWTADNPDNPAGHS